MNWVFVFQNGLLFGGLISLMMSVMIVVSLRVSTEMWAGDAPPEIKAVLPPMSARAKRLRYMVAIPMFAFLIALTVWAVARVYQANGGFPGFAAVAATIWIAYQTFNLVDLLLIDWLVVETIRPPFMMIPGAEAFRERRFYLFHLIGFGKGFVGITLFSLLAAGVLTGIDLLF